MAIPRQSAYKTGRAIVSGPLNSPEVRTRTVSLGICAVRASMAADLRSEVSASHHERPPLAVANCTLIARPGVELAWFLGQLEGVLVRTVA